MMSKSVQELRSTEYKSRNILTLEERVAVINDYRQNPFYTRIAEKFDCSAKQIKNIIANRKEVLSQYANSQSDQSINEARRRRQEKIDFLGKVVYEFVERAVYHDIKINFNVVQEKALQVREAIAVSNFFPNSVWMQDFKIANKISNFNLSTLKQTISFPKPKKSSLNCIDIIKYVSQSEKATQEQLQQNEEVQLNKNRELKQETQLVGLDTHLKRDDKVEFLSSVVYEFVERATYHSIIIDINAVQEKALQVKEAIDIKNFFPNHFWVESFKTAYKISNFDLASLQKAILFSKPKAPSLNCSDLIQFVSEREGVKTEGQLRHKGNASEQHRKGCTDVEMLNVDSSIIKYEVDIDDNADDLECSDANKKLTAKYENPIAMMTPNCALVPHIANSQDAMIHLKALEEFAMLSDNYRAIGLLTQLEKVFINGG